MYRIGMILENPFPPDIRVEKEAKALLSAGFQVELLCAASNQLPASEQTPYRLQIFREPIRRKMLTRSLEGITLFETAWLEPLQGFIAERKPDILHVHDFPLLKTVLHVAESAQIPVVADMHENMPAALVVQRKTRRFYLRPLDTLIHNYYLWRWNEMRLLPRCRHILVVVPEAAERLLKYGIPAERITVVSNTESESTFLMDGIDSEIVSRYRHEWVVSYVGGVGPHRGVDTAIKAILHVVHDIPNFRLLIIGVRKDYYLSRLMQLVKRLKVEKWVEFIGWQPFDKVNTFISMSSVCLVPHNNFEHTQTTVPHKLFQYMLAGKPVVVSDVRPLKRIVEETQSGIVFKANDPLSLAHQLIELHRNTLLAEMLGKNGYTAAHGLYSWNHDAQRLVDMYRAIELSGAS
jgi:glycosyltransferase involved in cell wall biosynthesis